MMRRLYVRCFCSLYPCEDSSVILVLAIPHALLLERFNHILVLRRDILTIARLLSLRLLLATTPAVTG